jgi:hypothetical protein
VASDGGLYDELSAETCALDRRRAAAAAPIVVIDGELAGLDMAEEVGGDVVAVGEADDEEL